jgi:hypothetical protein
MVCLVPASLIHNHWLVGNPLLIDPMYQGVKNAEGPEATPATGVDADLSSNVINISVPV